MHFTIGLTKMWNIYVSRPFIFGARSVEFFIGHCDVAQNGIPYGRDFLFWVGFLWKDLLPTRDYPTRQGSTIIRRLRTWRWVDDLLWARMEVFRTSFYVPASVKRNSYVSLWRDVDTTSFLRPRYVAWHHSSLTIVLDIIALKCIRCKCGEC